ncbi:MAG: ABC transporter permease, partial [Lachnospiraceae bacterium]|nr:ABC transporter permease [Lachnospiraceae bacterium]
MRKKKALFKDSYMELKKSWPRFLSILVMVMLGVAFFSGIRASGPDMKQSADAFYDKTSLMDIRVLGDLGMTEDDIKEIEQIDGVEKVEASYSADVLWNASENQVPVKLMSETKELDQITVVKGRLPKTEKECLIDEKLYDSFGCEIGEQISFQSGTEDDLADTIKGDTYTIVGVGTSPYYLSLERGTTKIGTGELEGFVLLTPAAFSLEAYTQLVIGVDGGKELLCYSDEYEDLVEEKMDAIEAIADVQCSLRYSNVKTEAEEKIADGEEEIADVEKKLADGQK